MEQQLKPGSSFTVFLIDPHTKAIHRTLNQPGIYSVGRKSSSKRSSVEIETNDGYMSGEHFSIIISNKLLVTVKDNGSANGTHFYNPQLKQFLKLRKGEEVIIDSLERVKAGQTEITIKVLSERKPESRSGQTELIIK
jgi:hypothetical protein